MCMHSYHVCNDYVAVCYVLFFFSSRRRHTRYWRDWSSDVCSSDLTRSAPGGASPQAVAVPRSCSGSVSVQPGPLPLVPSSQPPSRRVTLTPYRYGRPRSGKRRVGEEGKTRGSAVTLKTKNARQRLY